MEVVCLPIHPAPAPCALRPSPTMKRLLLLVPLVLALLAPACRRSPDSSHDTAGHSHEHGHGHSHTPPHGGTAVVLGNEAYHLELVQDTETGTLTAYVLDGHMENFIRIGAPSLTLEITVDGKPASLVLNAVANPATDETVGDTSQFAGQADWLKSVNRFDGRITALIIRGTAFENIPFRFPEGNEHRH